MTEDAHQGCQVRLIMLKLFSKKNSGFGLDIAGSSLKLFELNKIGSEISVLGYNTIALPKGLIVNDIISDSKTLAYLLKQAVQKPLFGKFSGNSVAVSLPESKSFVRVIQIPNMTKAEIETAIPVEAESFIPLPINQVYLDWQVLSDKGDKIEVLIIASPKEFIDNYIKILEEADLGINTLEVESQSCHRALIPTGSNLTYLIVDIDSFRTSLIMVEAGNLQFTSSIPIAGNSFTEGIARALGVSSQKAELIKCKVGMANTAEYPNIRSALQPLLTTLSAEIKNIIKFHAEHSEQKLEKIILAGGGARLKNLVESLQAEFSLENIPVELGNPLVNLPNIKALSLDLNESLSFTTAIGLAMRGIVEK